MTSPLNDLYRLRTGVRTKRISSYNKAGSNHDYVTVPAGETYEVAAIPGAGIIKHIWFTFNHEDPFFRRNTVIRMYWDGETNPSVEAPVGDLFGQGWGESYNFISLPLAAAPKNGRGLNSYFPMPFGDGARITLENQSDKPIKALYFYVDYELHDTIPASAGRFHAWWNRELTESAPAEGETEWSVISPQANHPSTENNYIMADIEGHGHFVGINYYVDSPGPMWYGEGDDMWLIDGEPWPGSLHGTGTEDFFNSSWAPNELYAHPYFGYARVPNKLGFMGRTHCYRFFLEDPIHFDRSLHASIEHGHNNNLTLDLSTVAYWYQAEPHKPFPPLPPKEARQNMPEIGIRDIHVWRHEYRKARGGGSQIWGHEWRPEQ